MKILMLCKKFPYPLKDGESIAISNLCRELKKAGCDISLLSMNTSKHYSDLSALPADYNYFSAIHSVNVDNTVKPWQALTSIFTGESYHIRRFRSGLFKAKLIEVLQAQQFDIIQLETLYLAPYVDTIRKHSDAKIVMRAHNVEHEIWERITQQTGPKLRKLYLAYLTRKLKEYEIDQFPAYDYLVTLTDRDLRRFQESGYVNGASAAPIGFDIDAYPNASPAFGPDMSICFIGSLDWTPNREGLSWFLDHCWPEMHRRWPKLTLHIAGRNTPMELMEISKPNITVHGEVGDATAFVQRHAMMIVPLFSGSGMRVKIVEGMAMGKVVVTTHIGMEGIEGHHLEELLLANTADDFIHAIEYCINHPEEARKIGQRARVKVAEQFDHEKAAREILDIYHKLLHEPADHTGAAAVHSLN